MVKPIKKRLFKKEKIENDESKPIMETNIKRKYEDDVNADIDKLTLLDGLSVPKDGSISLFKKRKKIATADNILKQEQEKV